MNKLFILSLLVFLSFTLYCQDNNLKRYEFENAYAEKITKVVNTAFESETTEKIYIAEWGLKEVHIKHEKRNIKMINKTDESKSISIMEGKWMTSYDPDKKKGTKIEIPLYDNLSSLNQTQLQNFSEQMKGALNTTTTELPNENILGFNCKVTDAVSDIAGMKTTSKIWLYKNFVMKIESSGMGTSTSELVTVFKEGEKADNSVFTVPPDVNISEPKNIPLLKK